MGASRWRTWDLECLEETLLSRDQDNEVEPSSAVGSRRIIPRVDFSSLVLPKEALFTTNNNNVGRGSRSRGRGRSLANRALGFDRPSRRPGERDTSEQASHKTTLGSQFFGSEYLYEELFPSLDQSIHPQADQKPPIQSKSVWNSKLKRKKESSNQSKKNATGDKSISDQTNVPNTSANNKDEVSFLTSCNYVREDTGISKNEGYFVQTLDTIPGRNALQYDKIKFGKFQNNAQLDSFVDSSGCFMTQESGNILKEKQPGGVNELPKNSEFEDHQNSTIIKEFVQEVYQIESEDNEQFIHCYNNNEAEICVHLSTNAIDEIGICEEITQVQILGTGDTESNNGNIELTTNEQYSSSRHLPIQQDAKTDHNRPTKDDNYISSITNTLLSHSDFEKPNDSELESHLETNDTKENLEDSVDTSASEEMEPCDILLENLPLALTEEELGEIVEPYGEATSYNFKEKDTCKQCIARMSNSISGELLVESLDGLELDGYRIKATMIDS